VTVTRDDDLPPGVSRFQVAKRFRGFGERVRAVYQRLEPIGLERHHWACGLMMSPARVRADRMRYMDSLLGRLRQAGFSAELTDRAYHALDSHIIGSTLWGVGYSAGAPLPTDFGATFLRNLPIDEYPYLAEHTEQHLAMPQAGETVFEFGLDLILDGLERILGAD
jgi:hypothetical protein